MKQSSYVSEWDLWMLRMLLLEKPFVYKLLINLVSHQGKMYVVVKSGSYVLVHSWPYICTNGGNEFPRVRIGYAQKQRVKVKFEEKISPISLWIRQNKNLFILFISSFKKPKFLDLFYLESAVYSDLSASLILGLSSESSLDFFVRTFPHVLLLCSRLLDFTPPWQLFSLFLSLILYSLGHKKRHIKMSGQIFKFKDCLFHL